jgi:signal transduction histidine kinase
MADATSLAVPEANKSLSQADHPWHVLVVDDDEVVHSSTEIALAHVGVEGRKLQLSHAYTAHEALEMVEKHPELAVALVDVVMETSDAGLRLVQQIRQLPGRSALRLILRTGQPGYAPELETIQHYDINDYWSKLDQSRTKLLVGLTTAIRSFRQFADIEAQRDALVRLNEQLEAAIQAERQAVQARVQAEQALVEMRESAESEIGRRTNELLDTVRSLETFNHMVAHDLRGPLSGVSGLTNLIKRRLESGDTDQIPRWLDLVSTQTERLSTMVGALLELSRLARSPVQRRACVLGDLAREALEAVHSSSPQAVEGISFEIDATPTVAVDPQLMRQVFVNLIGNAAKFSRGVPAPVVRVTAEQQAQQVVVRVVDNGVGFDAERATGLFQPFVRLHGEGYQGAGMGLATVKRIVEMHAGRVCAESAPGQGATFRFSLPDGTSPALPQGRG